jgi:hypothetical protein
MVKTSFHFTDEQMNQFKAIAAAQGRPVSQVVRGALDEWLIARKSGGWKPSLEDDNFGVNLWVWEDDGPCEYVYRGAEVVHDGPMVHIIRKSDGKTLAILHKERLQGLATW